MGNSTSCTNANTNQLTGIILNEKINSETGRVESIFTFPNYNGCTARTLKIDMSNDGNNLTIKNSGSNTNLFGFISNNSVSNNYVKENKIIQKFTNSRLNNNRVCLSYNMIILLIIILISIYYLNNNKIEKVY
jgi:hypothetical protein